MCRLLALSFVFSFLCSAEFKCGVCLLCRLSSHFSSVHSVVVVVCAGYLSLSESRSPLACN